MIEGHSHILSSAAQPVQPVGVRARPHSPCGLLEPSPASFTCPKPSGFRCRAQGRCTAPGTSPTPMPLVPPGGRGSYLGVDEGPTWERHLALGGIRTPESSLRVLFPAVLREVSPKRNQSCRSLLRIFMGTARGSAPTTQTNEAGGGGGRERSATQARTPSPVSACASSLESGVSHPVLSLEQLPFLLKLLFSRCHFSRVPLC